MWNYCQEKSDYSEKTFLVTICTLNSVWVKYNALGFATMYSAWCLVYSSTLRHTPPQKSIDLYHTICNTQSITSQKTALFIATTVRTSYLIFAWAVLVFKSCLLVGNLCLTAIAMTIKLNTQAHAMFWALLG
jgi:hypothetical protein